MVICKYFLNGYCRFGTKCVNEHLDVKQLLKSDVESAVNGNQWPLSCFGPFKEKPSIPNFIEDQSFEEIRMLCYGSKKQNFFESFNQQFTKEVIEAKNKMKMLLSLNKEVMDIVLNLYNTSEPSKGTTQPSSSNPFGLAVAPTTQNTNLFGNTAPTQGGIFGGNAGSTFGSSNNTTTTSNIFGGAQKSILGQSAFESFSTQPQQQQQQQQSNSLFGSVQPQQQAQQTNTFGGNIFAQTAQQTPVGGASIFGGVQQQQSQPQPFGGTNTPIFAQAQASGNIFSQAAQQQAQPQTQVGGNIFAQQTQQPQVPGFGVFAQTTQPAAPAFGGQMPQTQQQLPFSAAQPQQQMGFFGQTQQQQQMDQQKQNAGNIFTSQMTSQPQYRPQQCFNAATFNSPFAPAQHQQQQQQTNIFAQAAAAGYQQQPQKPMQSDRTYSKMENLTPEEIEAFKADTFELGKIPFNPPPRELVN